MNKKGAELTVGTIVIIVLAVIVLVVLVLGFTGGWGNLWDRMSGMFGGGANIDSIKQACGVACTTQSQNDYCVADRSVVLEDDSKVSPASCYELSVLYPTKLGIEACDQVACDLTCEQMGGKWAKTQDSTTKKWSVEECKPNDPTKQEAKKIENEAISLADVTANSKIVETDSSDGKAYDVVCCIIVNKLP